MLLLLVPCLALCQAKPRRGEVVGTGVPFGASEEYLAAPRAGTLCRLVARDVVVAASDAGFAVHRLRFALPPSYGGTPRCCGGEEGIVHVNVRAPEADAAAAPSGGRLRPYSATLDGDTFELHVKICDDRGGVSAFLGAVAVGEEVHVPEIRAVDYVRGSRAAAMVCFGVGVTECVPAAEALLRNGGEVRALISCRDASQVVMGEALDALAERYPGRVRLRYYFSRPRPGDVPPRGGDHRRDVRAGRVDAAALADAFGGNWSDGGLTARHLHAVGTEGMKVAAFKMSLEAGLFADQRQARGHPRFALMLGPYGENAPWRPLSPPPAPEL